MNLWQTLEKHNFHISTDTRKEIAGTVYFALKGENFDGNKFVHDALMRGAVAAVSDNPENAGEHVFIVQNVLTTFQEYAARYREQFTIPIIAVAGSNGKTTSKELLREVLSEKHTTYATKGSFNNNVGVPTSLFELTPEVEIGVFEIGANHAGEHTRLLNILKPTHVVVTNNGLDHLDGFGSPEGVRAANKEVYDWAEIHGAHAFVNAEYTDLIADSASLSRTVYTGTDFTITAPTPLTYTYKSTTYTTKLIGDYNMPNAELALAVGQYFDVPSEAGCRAVCQYTPTLRRSEIREKDGVRYIVDCYNANPSSMQLSLDSFVRGSTSPRGVILGDMLELGTYSDSEHRKMLEYVAAQHFDIVILIGSEFARVQEVLAVDNIHWFPTSLDAKKWFVTQKFTGYTFLLKGSRGIAVEKVIE